MQISLDLRDVDTESQYEFWQGVTPAAYSVGRRPDGNGLNAKASFWGLNDLMASRFSSGAHRIIRTTSAAKRAPVNFFKLRLYLAGSAQIHDGGKVHDLRAGDVYMIDQSREWSARYERHDQYSIFIPHDLVGYDPSQQPVVRTFRSDFPKGRLLQLAIRAFFEALEYGEDNTIGLLSVVENALHDGLRTSREPRFKASRDEAIRFMARRASFGLKLDSSTLARDFGVSRATVFRIFREDGGLQRFRKKAHLDVAFNRLAGNELKRGELSQMALKLGFYSAAHFSDAFLDKFGVRPSEAVGLSPNTTPPAGPINDPSDLEATMLLARDLYARLTG